MENTITNGNLQEDEDKDFKQNIIEAIIQGDEESFKKLFLNDKRPVSSITLFEIASKHGKLNMIKLIIELNNNYHNFITVEVSSEAAKGKHMHILEFLKSIKRLDHKYLYVYALKNENFECLEWLTENYSELKYLRKSKIIHLKDTNKLIERITYDVITYNKPETIVFNNDVEAEIFWNEKD